MDLLWETIYPPAKKPETWKDYTGHVLRTLKEGILELWDTFVEFIRVCIISRLCLIMEQFKVAFQMLMDNFHRHLVPSIYYLFEQFTTSIKTLGERFYEYVIVLYERCLHVADDVFQYSKFCTSTISTNCIYMFRNLWNHVTTWTILVYNYFSMFPSYKLCCLCVILVLIICCLIVLVYTFRKHKHTIRKTAKVAFDGTDKSVALSHSVDSDDEIMAVGDYLDGTYFFPKNSGKKSIYSCAKIRVLNT